MVRIDNVLIAPVNTEKVVQMSGKYGFYVHVDADKSMIKSAIKRFYGVDVAQINVINLKPKKRTGRGKPSTKRVPLRKAIVTLPEGEKLNYNDLK